LIAMASTTVPQKMANSVAIDWNASELRMVDAKDVIDISDEVVPIGTDTG